MAPLEQIDLDHGERIARLEEGMKQVCENHIPHIWSAVREIQLWIRGIAVGVGLTVLGLIIEHFAGK